MWFVSLTIIHVRGVLTMPNSKIVIFSTCLASLGLAGCVNKPLQHQIDLNYKQTASKINKNLESKQSEKFNVNKGDYTDEAYYDVKPTWETRHVQIHGFQQPLSQIVNIILAKQDVHVSYVGDTAHQLINIDYSGDALGALNYIMNKNNIYFQIDGKSKNAITWSSTETKIFNIAYLPGTTSFSVGGTATDLSDGTTASSNSTNSNASSLKGDISVWNDIQTSVNKLLSSDGKLIVNQSSGTITVIDKPLNVAQIGKVIKSYNKTLSKRVTIKVKILEVQLNKQHQYGIDWNLVYKGMAIGGMSGNALSTIAGFSLGGNDSSNSTSTTSTPSSQSNWSGTSAFINALDGQGKASMIDEPTITTLNNSPSTISITDNQAYIKSTQSTTTGSGPYAITNYTVNPDNIITGLRLTLIPHIQGNQVFLSIDGTLSSLENITSKSFGSGNTDNSLEIQLPQTTSKTFNQRVMVLNNHILVLSGLRTSDSKSNSSKNFELAALGSDQQNVSNKELVVLIEPTIVG
jgi:type IVB pilus formation R64 PilN family outer membrane protein